MAEVSDPFPSSPDVQETVTTSNSSMNINASTTSLHKLVKELMGALEAQEAELFSIACSDVNESAQGPLSRAKVGNKEALQKLAEVIEIMKNIPLETYAQEQEQEKPQEHDNSLNHSLSSLPVSPIPRLDSRTSPPSSPSKSYLQSLSWKNKRLSFGGSKSIDMSMSSDGLGDRSQNPLSMSLGGSESPTRPKKERRSITQFLTLKPQRSATMAHSNSTPTLHTTVRAEVVSPHVYALDERRTSLPPSPSSSSTPSSPLSRSPSLPKQKEKVQPEDMYTLHIHEASRMLFEKKRNLMQQQPSPADISA